jgi:hypothetical protein
MLKFQVLKAARMKTAMFWVAELCTLAEFYRRFRGACCLHHRPDNGGRKKFLICIPEENYESVFVIYERSAGSVYNSQQLDSNLSQLNSTQLTGIKVNTKLLYSQ